MIVKRSKKNYLFDFVSINFHFLFLWHSVDKFFRHSDCTKDSVAVYYRN